MGPNLNQSWWCHQMETISALLAICAENSPVNSPHKGQWRGALMFSLIHAWINDWVNNHEAGDLTHYCAHYDVTVMVNLTSNEIFWHSFQRINVYLNTEDITPLPCLCLKFTHLKSQPHLPGNNELTHWDRIVHICFSKLSHHWLL